MSKPLPTSERGFQQGDRIPSTYGGYIRVYESSAADGPHVWVNIVSPARLSSADDPNMVDGVAHLTLEDACALCNQLTRLIDNHYQLS